VRVVLTEQFVRTYIDAPPEIQKTFGKQLALFLRNWRHFLLDIIPHPK